MSNNLLDMLNVKLSAIDRNSYNHINFNDCEISEYDVTEHHVFERSGVELLVSVDSKIVVGIYVYSSQNDSGYLGYTGDLPLNIDMNKSRVELRKLLGEPQISKEGKDDPLLGFTKCLDAYKYDNFDLQIDYTEDMSGIDMVSYVSKKYDQLMGG